MIYYDKLTHNKNPLIGAIASTKCAMVNTLMFSGVKGRYLGMTLPLNKNQPTNNI